MNLLLLSALLTGSTMRLDYYHSGDASRELFSLDRIVLEPLPWPGSPAQAVDESNLGKYLFEVVDRGTNRVVFSRGFASIYGEWETTEEAAKANRTFHESLRFPAPVLPAGGRLHHVHQEPGVLLRLPPGDRASDRVLHEVGAEPLESRSI